MLIAPPVPAAIAGRRAMNRTLGIILIALGLVGLVWGGLRYTVLLPPLAGALALAGGIVLVAAAGRK
jgi:hypothetical protein